MQHADRQLPDPRGAEAVGRAGEPATLSAEPAAVAGDDRRWPAWACCAFLAVLTYAAHFWHAGKFSVYEDDLFVVPMAAAKDWGAIASWIKSMFAGYMHGRPVGHSLWVLVPAAGYLLGGLHAVYVLGSLIVAANVVLFYLLLRRCYGEPAAFLGALAFCLFPADTSRELLVHTNILQPAVLFSLVAAHCYLSRRFVAAYVMAALVLVTYESPMLPFLLVPLMVGPWDRKALKRLVIHWAICGGLIAAAVGVRLLLGEGWIATAATQAESLPHRIVKCMYIGPATSMSQFYERFTYTVARLRTHGGWAPVAAAGVAMAAILFWVSSRRRGHDAQSVRGQVAPAVRPLLLGLVMLSTAYILAFPADHYPPTATFGRMTSVHLAAAFGASIVVAWIGQVILVLAGAARLRAVAVAAIAGYFAVLTGFALHVQDGFVNAHRDQQEYWTRVLQLCPDLEDGTVVVLEGKLPTHNWFVLPSSWSDPLMLPAVLNFPREFRRPPVMVRFGAEHEWTNNLTRQGGSLAWSTPPLPGFRPGAGEPISEGNVILLRARDGRIARVDGQVDIGGVPFRLKPAPAATEPVVRIPVESRGPLYSLFIKSEKR